MHVHMHVHVHYASYASSTHTCNYRIGMDIRYILSESKYLSSTYIEESTYFFLSYIHVFYICTYDLRAEVVNGIYTHIQVGMYGVYRVYITCICFLFLPSGATPGSYGN